MNIRLPSLKQLNEFSIEGLREFATEKIDAAQTADMLDNPPGIVPYKLYAYLSTTFNDGIILDLGTNKGGSALAASFNPKNHVLSYDINDFGQKGVEKDNITFKIMDWQSDDEIDYEKIKMIIIDTDHSGSQENAFMKWLTSKGWSGILLLDDIYLNHNMVGMWENISASKREVTRLGHHRPCGTGIVEFGK